MNSVQNSGRTAVSEYEEEVEEEEDDGDDDSNEGEERKQGEEDDLKDDAAYDSKAIHNPQHHAVGKQLGRSVRSMQSLEELPDEPGRKQPVALDEYGEPLTRAA